MIDGVELRKQLADEYAGLLSSIDGEKPDSTLCGFAPLIGSKFHSSNARLLVCGRSVDGWRVEFPQVDINKPSYREIINRINTIPPKDASRLLKIASI